MVEDSDIYFETERLVIRKFRLSDLPTFLTYRNDTHVARYQTWKTPLLEKEAIEFINSQILSEIGIVDTWHQLAIELKENSLHIGDCAIYTQHSGNQGEIGITISREYHRKGFAFEVLRNLFKFIFNELKFHRVTALVDSNNVGSLFLMEKLGMRKEGLYKESYYDKASDKWTDEVFFAILEDEFLS